MGIHPFKLRCFSIFFFYRFFLISLIFLRQQCYMCCSELILKLCKWKWWDTSTHSLCVAIFCKLTSTLIIPLTLSSLGSWTITLNTADDLRNPNETGWMACSCFCSGWFVHAPFLEKCHTRNSTLYDITQGHKKKTVQKFTKAAFPPKLPGTICPRTFFPADLSAFPSRSKAGVFNLWGAPPLAAHCSRCVCLFVHYSLLCMCTWMGEMQSTNSQYGTPFLATCHVLSFFISTL